MIKSHITKVLNLEPATNDIAWVSAWWRTKQVIEHIEWAETVYCVHDQTNRYGFFSAQTTKLASSI